MPTKPKKSKSKPARKVAGVTVVVHSTAVVVTVEGLDFAAMIPLKKGKAIQYKSGRSVKPGSITPVRDDSGGRGKKAGVQQ